MTLKKIQESVEDIKSFDQVVKELSENNKIKNIILQ